ncbi:MAG: cell division protein SepF [Eubacterium sp.]|nr:cell division protein SepF [Eubacterium sp.]
MSIKDKFMDMMKISDVDDSEEFDEEFDGYEEGYDEELEEEFDEEEEEEFVEKPAHKKPIFSFHRKPKDVPEDYEEEDGRVVPFHNKLEEGETVRVIKPQEFNEAQIVADFLKDGKTIVVNLEGIEISQAQRIIDFIGGASFAVDGSLKAISNNIFIVAPGNIEVSGDLRDEIVGENIISPELGKF